MNISGTASLAALAGYQTGETPSEDRVALLKTAQEQAESQAAQLIQVIDPAGSANPHDSGLDTYV